MLIALGSPQSKECGQFWLKNLTNPDHCAEIALKAWHNLYTKSKKIKNDRLFLWVWSQNKFHVYMNGQTRIVTNQNVLPLKKPDQTDEKYYQEIQEWFKENIQSILNFYNDNFGESIRQSTEFYENMMLNYCKETFGKTPFFQEYFKVKIGNRLINIENDEAIVYAKSLANFKESQDENRVTYLKYRVFTHQKITEIIPD